MLTSISIHNPLLRNLKFYAFSILFSMLILFQFSQLTFAINYQAGFTPSSVTSADFNGDGNIDIAVANQLSNDVSVFLNNAKGGFLTAVNITAGSGPFAVSSADFNNDGKADMAVTNRTFNNVSVLLGNGTGGFAAAVNFFVQQYPSSLTTADFNRDGNTDMAVVASSSIYILLGDGAGGFAAAVNVAAGSVYAFVTSGDFNGDGFIDIAATATDGIYVLMGNGGGGFAAAVNVAAGSGYAFVTTADFNADTSLDIVATSVIKNSSSQSVSLLLGDGKGGFAATQSLATGTAPTSITTADFNSDGKLDMVVANRWSNNISIFLGNGAGGFATTVNFSIQEKKSFGKYKAKKTSPSSITSADYNRDGFIDLAVANSATGDVSILHGTGTGTFLESTPPTVTVLGSYNVTLNQGSTYKDFGATAVDNVDGDITASIQTINNVNITVVGKYTVTYTVTDAAGNTGQAVRKVSVMAAGVASTDTTPPTITLKGNAKSTINLGATYVDAGATANDNIDGTLTNFITVVNNVNSSKVGAYLVTYNVKDAAGNAAAEVARTVTVVDPNAAVKLSLGADVFAGGTYSAALKADGTIVPWGTSNGYGQMTTPAGLVGVHSLAVGSGHVLALNSDGTVIAWGNNGQSQATVPVGLTNVIAIAADWTHSLALKKDGTVVGWGDNTFGEITIPAGLAGVTAIATGFHHTLALKSDGTVVAWGKQTFRQPMVPQGLNGVIAVGAGEWISIALKSDGTVVEWESNGANSTAPAGLTGVSKIAVGRYHTVALKTDGTVVAWGDDTSGQATPPAGLTGVVGIAAGYKHSVALKNDGTIVAWGDNTWQQATPPTINTNTGTANTNTANLGNADPQSKSCISSPSSLSNPFVALILLLSIRYFRKKRT